MFVGIGVGIGRQRFGGGIFSAYAARVVADGGVTEAGSCVDAVSTLLQSGSLLLVPSGYKSGKVYSEIPTNGNGDLTFTRASTAVRTNSTGLLESMATGVPRLSYMYGSCPALLLEPQRTNLVLQSEDLTNGWSTEGLTVTANQTTAPDGNTTADLLQETAVTDVHRVYRSGITTVASTNYAFSFYVKKDTRRYVRLVLNQTTNAAIWAAAQFDLDNQTFTSGVGIGGGTFVSASISPVANGFYRITLVATVTSTITFAFLALSDGTTISSADLRGCNTYVGNTSNRIWGWGAQLESGAYATTYIPTTTASATRVADACFKTGISSLIGQAEGTMFVQVTAKYKNADIASINTGATNAVYIVKTSLNYYRATIYAGGVSVVAITTSTVIETSAKIAVVYKSGSTSLFINGSKIQTDTTTFTFTTALNSFYLQPNYLIGLETNEVQQSCLFPTALTDTECIALTS
jgi:hypothetical protein